tara:strand:- start:1330 stop:1980 length:651 start_codon:yes stop_codon:yes gene_type:complete
MKVQFLSIQIWVKNLRHFDMAAIDWYDLSSWPKGLRVSVLSIFFIICLSASGFLVLKEKIDLLLFEKNKELSLKIDYQKKYAEAADLTKLKQQVLQMQTIFEGLIGQLPSETEVPALLEDITHAGVNNGLVFKKIELKDEIPKDFFIELPIMIDVSGSYHDLAAFVSGVSSLPRIVTLHDFDISLEDNSSDQLSMTILAKTYRYKIAEKNSAMAGG